MPVDKVAQAPVSFARWAWYGTNMKNTLSPSKQAVVSKLYVKADLLCQRVRELKNKADGDGDLLAMMTLIHKLERAVEAVETIEA